MLEKLAEGVNGLSLNLLGQPNGHSSTDSRYDSNYARTTKTSARDS